MPQIPLETLGNCGGVISCYCLNVTQQCAALGYNPLYPLHKRNRLIAVVHTNSHLDDEAGASVKFATTVFVGFLWKKNPKKTHISWLAFRRARERGIRSYTSSSLFMVPRFFFFFCANGVRISTDIYSFGFIWAFRIDRWRHPPLALLPSRPAASPPLTQPICDMCQCNVQTVY